VPPSREASATTFGTNSDCSTIGGGFGNTIDSYRTSATIGGWANIASGSDATVAGGVNNTASGDEATVPGGLGNIAGGDLSFAAGHRAKANRDGTFVWADSQNLDFESTITNQFSVRASGGVRFSDETPALSFGSQARQMINLYSTTYGVGIQSSTMYFRSNKRFCWFDGGTHSDTENSPRAPAARC
jgi:hypothetical protein